MAKRARTGKAWEQMDRFIRYQIQGWDTIDVAKGVRSRDSISETAINSAVRDLARLLGIPLRPRNSMTQKT